MDAVLALHRTIGNRAVARMLEQRPVRTYTGIQRAPASATATQQKPAPKEEVDAFLAARLELFSVTLAGLDLYVGLSPKYSWIGRYGDRALAVAAIAAATRRIFRTNASFDEIKRVHDRLLNREISYEPHLGPRARTEPHTTTIALEALESMRSALGLRWEDADRQWRRAVALNRFLDRGLLEARDRWEQIRDELPPTEMRRKGLSPNALFRMLDERRERSLMVHIAARHSAGKPLVRLILQDAELANGGREPSFADFLSLSSKQWARIVLNIASAAREVSERISEQHAEELRKEQLNQFLEPHRLAVEHPAKFIVENYDPAVSVHLHALGGLDITGGQRFTNARGEAIYVLRVDSTQVIYQNERDRKLYRQSLPGLEQELIWGTFALVAEKTRQIIPLTKWMVGLIGALFPPARVPILASEVISAGYKLAGHWDELTETFASLRISYQSIDEIVPGLLPAVKDAVLDKETLAILDFSHPDFGAWFNAALKLLRRRLEKVVAGGFIGDAAAGVIKKALRVVGKVLAELGLTIVWVGPAVWHSADIDRLAAVERAEKVILEKLRNFGIKDAIFLATVIASLSRDDLERLAREISDAVERGKEFARLIGEISSW